MESSIILSLLIVILSSLISFSLGYLKGYTDCSEWWRAKTNKMLEQLGKTTTKQKIDMEV